MRCGPDTVDHTLLAAKRAIVDVRACNSRITLIAWMPQCANATHVAAARGPPPPSVSALGNCLYLLRPRHEYRDSRGKYNYMDTLFWRPALGNSVADAPRVPCGLGPWLRSDFRADAQRHSWRPARIA